MIKVDKIILNETKINPETSRVTFSQPPQLLQDIFFFLRYQEVETQFEIQTGILGFKYLSKTYIR